jgi:flagellar biosynthesis/type III secretory pathway protein FliH
MNDSSEASTPFTFADLCNDNGRRFRTTFVTLFPSPKAGPEIEPEPEDTTHREDPPIEDQARRVFEEAYAEGEKAGYEMGMRRVESTAKRLEKHIAELLAFKEVLEERYKRLSTEISLMFAEAIVLRECSEKKDILEAMIRKALEACEDKGEIVIRVRSEDLPCIKEMASEHLRVLPDDTLKEPGFIIETSFGDIDGRISCQIEELRNMVLGHHAG